VKVKFSISVSNTRVLARARFSARISACSYNRSLAGFVDGVFGPRPVFGANVQFFSNTSASSAAFTSAARVHNAVFGVANASNAFFAISSARNRPARVASRLASPCVLGENVSSAARLAITSASIAALECLPAKRSRRSLFATFGTAAILAAAAAAVLVLVLGGSSATLKSNRPVVCRAR
jgi:hypothetical protein